MGRYAENTSVDSSTSRTEIERTLTRYGATSFSYGWEPGRAAIGFKMNDRLIRFMLPMPDRQAREFTHTPERGQPRTKTAADTAYEKSVRQRWRALALMVKAKLEAVASGIVTFEEEFLAHTVLPNGATVFQEVAPAIEESYRSGEVRPLLQLGPGEDR